MTKKELINIGVKKLMGLNYNHCTHKNILTDSITKNLFKIMLLESLDTKPDQETSVAINQLLNEVENQ